VNEKWEPIEYLLADECTHEPPLRPMLNGEFACDACLHVALRADGTEPVYERMPEHLKNVPEAEV
jgi:hypothetical protein